MASSSLNSKISDLHIAKIAKKVVDWKTLAPELGLTPPEQKSIEVNAKDDYEEQKRAALRKWKDMKGREATYNAFIAVAKAEGETDLAEFVEGLILPQLSPDSPIPVSSRNIQTPVVKKTDKVSKRTESGISSGKKRKSAGTSMQSSGATKRAKYSHSATKPSSSGGATCRTLQRMHSQVEQVKCSIDALEETFGNLVKRAVNILIEFKTDVKDVVYELSTLSATEKPEHKVFLETNLEKLRKSEDHLVLFGYLNLYWTYLSPNLLKHLVNKVSPLSEMKGDMEAYMESLRDFRMQTPLDLFCQVDTQHVEPPEGFTRVVTKFEKIKSNDKLSMTLQDIEEFRQKYGSHYQLRDFALMLNEVKHNCYIVIFFVPESVVEQLQSNVPDNVLEEYEVIQLEVSETCVFVQQNLQPSTTEVCSSSKECMDTTLSPVKAGTADTTVSKDNTASLKLLLLTNEQPETGECSHTVSSSTQDVLDAEPLVMDTSSGDVKLKVSDSETGTVSVCYVEAKIRKIKKQFNHLKKTTVEDLERNNIPVNRVVQTLRELSADDNGDHKLFTKKHMNIFEQAGSNSVLIGQLDFNMDYLSYHVLDYIICEFQLGKVMVQLETYKSELQKFRMKVPLSIFCQAKNRTSIKVSSEFKDVVAEFPLMAQPTLETVEQFQKEYAAYYKLRDCSLALAGINSHDSSFICTWLIPQSVADKLKKTLPREVFEENSVSRFSVSGTCIYHDHKKSSETGDDDYLFVENPSKDFFCPVTMDLLLQPHLTSCCGKHISQEAVRKLKKDGKGCPLCKREQWSTMLSLHYLRLVTELPVFCRDSHCDWQGELSQLEQHMQSYHAQSSSQASVKDDVSCEESSQGDRPSTSGKKADGNKIPVHQGIMALQQKFNDLKKKSIACLEKNKISLTRVIEILKSIKADKEHIQFSESHLSTFSQTFDFNELFGALGFNMNYLSCQVLDYLVNELDLNDVKHEMEAYKLDLQMFKTKTPISLFCDTQAFQSHIEPPPNFRAASSTFQLSKKMQMLEDIEIFQREFCYCYGLQYLTMLLAKVAKTSEADLGSVTVTWFIPESVVEKLSITHIVPRKLLMKYSVTKLMIDGNCMYRLHPKMKPTRSDANSSAHQGPEIPGVSKSYSRKDYHYVERPSEDFFCPVTMDLLLQPHLTSCCGRHISHKAVAEIQKKGEKCPLCKNIPLSTILNKHFQREVKRIRVFCDNQCSWQGELSALDYHLQSCPKRDVPLMAKPFLNETEGTCSNQQSEVMVTTNTPEEHPYASSDSDSSTLTAAPTKDVPLSSDVPQTAQAAFIEDTDISLATPEELMKAVTNSDIHKVKHLLSKNVDPNALSSMSESTPLLAASGAGNVEIVHLLLDYGADPNLGDNRNWTPLLYATRNNHLETVDVLLERGANADAISDTWWSSLMAAVFKGHDDIALRIIRAGATPHIQDKNQTNALLLAAEIHKTDTVVNVLLDHLQDPSHLDIQDSWGATTLTYACMNNKVELLRRLLSMGANPNIPNNYGETPLGFARRLDMSEIEQQLLDSGAKQHLEAEGEQSAVTTEIEPGFMEEEHEKALVDVDENGALILSQQYFMYNGKKLDYVWEEGGISLHFSAAASSEKNIKISVATIGDVNKHSILPLPYRLMTAASATYKITASFPLPVAVKLRMKHCVFLEREESLTLMVADQGPPYYFKPLPGATFLPNSYCEVEVHSFSFFQILKDLFSPRPRHPMRLSLQLFYHEDSTATFVVTKNLPPHIDAVKQSIKHIHLEDVTMTSDNTVDAIALSVPVDYKGWHISSTFRPAKISIVDIDNYEPRQTCPKIKLQMEWKGSGNPTKENVCIPIEGGSIESFTLLCRPTPQIQGQSHQVQIPNQSQASSTPAEFPTSLSDPPTLPQLLTFPKRSGGVINIIEKVTQKYHDLGICLLNDYDSTITTNIEAQHKSDNTQKTKAIFKRWLEGTGREPRSWSMLVTVLKDIKLTTLAKEINDNFVS